MKWRIVVGDKQIASRVQSSSATSVSEGEYVLLQRSKGAMDKKGTGNQKMVEARTTEINRDYEWMNYKGLRGGRRTAR